MNKKTKDCVFSVLLIVFGCFVVYESLAMVERASKPPFNISNLSVSPALLPLLLGCGLIFFSLLLLVNVLRGEQRAASALFGHLRTSSVRFGRALGETDIRSMIVSVVIMAIYTFGVLGRVPFWLGAFLFLAVLMLFLRAGKLWAILAASAFSVAAMVVLFETFFKTTLP